MAAPLPIPRAHAALSQPTGYRRFTRVTFARSGVSRQLEPVSGSFTQDSRRSQRWIGNLSFAGNDLLPRRPGDLLTPFGTLVAVELGLTLLDGTSAVVPYGWYTIGKSGVRIDPGSRTVQVGLVDLSDRVDRYRFEAPLTVGQGADLAEMVDAVVTSRIGLNPAVSNTGTTLGAARVFGLDPQTGPWAEIQDVLSGFSRQVWYDRSGEVVIGAVDPSPSNAYPLDQLTSRSIDFDTRPYNVVVARGEPQDGSPPVQAVAYDDNPSSPTYAGTGPGTSPYGRVTRFYASPLLETVGQAQSAAQTLLAQHVGQGATHTLVRPYDPTVDAGDVVSVQGAVLAVDAVTVNLTGDTVMQVREL